VRHQQHDAARSAKKGEHVWRQLLGHVEYLNPVEV
jgi:hypothetical protein